MNFKESPYYDESLLGKHLYSNIENNHKIFTVQDFFNINNNQKEYHIKDKNKNYDLKVYDSYYELNCSNNYVYLFLVFDKPVHITGTYCRNIIAPEIIIKSNKCYFLAHCIAEKVIIDNKQKDYYAIIISKLNNTYFYNSKIRFWRSQINNFFIFNKELIFDNGSIFLDYYKTKCFGTCDDLKKKILTSERFEEGVVHIE